MNSLNVISCKIFDTLNESNIQYCNIQYIKCWRRTEAKPGSQTLRMKTPRAVNMQHVNFSCEIHVQCLQTFQETATLVSKVHLHRLLPFKIAIVISFVQHHQYIAYKFTLMRHKSFA